MHVMVIALLVAAAAAYSVGRPPGPSVAPELLQMLSQHRERISSLPANEYLVKYLMPRILLPRFLGYEESPRMLAHPSHVPQHDWLNKEIERINHMERIDDSKYYARGYPHFGGHTPYAQRIFQDSARERNMQGYSPTIPRITKIMPQHLGSYESDSFEFPLSAQDERGHAEEVTSNAEELKKEFALTPLDEGYFEPEDPPSNTSIPMALDGAHEGGGGEPMSQIEPPRQTRQNPNLSKTKNLVADNIEKFKTTIAHENNDVTDSQINMRETTPADPAESIYGVALIAAIGAAFTMAILVFAFGWYTLSKKAKAAADVDYPAYGVTGPTIDTSGDRKLAHSAHMYHYQHQKQQIIAMERNGLEQRNGSMSDPDSEEENEEGDYTVYECPGFATTGDMEVKNPLFADDPTPATPGKKDVTKPQPKE
ncbi:protein cab-1 isoform X1 [Manduca sexta]|uniref:Neural proliferation differentiation and control protein 1 n=1 Tax=Manduca sexta TaxID=7130 RepID=A0A921Z6W7_MANSE|nr:protein cab-1 isoform X1 [Manduca sexta]KAG6452461.1 hypothetical protein O3G_MSEX007664 [Manduca sexta]